ncbi:hypothetical protein BURPSPAST_AD0038 [Burkholderia pseudomallei Pasteur 52237]|nr:hypothetical protein BURPSPAST_AD0038 [Burkholderia pseudomallei Pasteur 52237]
MTAPTRFRHGLRISFNRTVLPHEGLASAAQEATEPVALDRGCPVMLTWAKRRRAI